MSQLVPLSPLAPTLVQVRLSEISFDEVVYPRKDHDPVLVQRYATVLDEIEAKQRYIAIATDKTLLDGKHRWLAYKKRYEGEDPLLTVLQYEVTAPHERLKLATALNSEHGWQLTETDKEATAKTLYAYGCTYDDIASTLSVGKATVSQWLSRTVKDNKDRRDRKIQEMWLACSTQDEIAQACGCSQQTVTNVVEDFTNAVLQNQNSKAAASHATDFAPPLYNVWKQQTASAGMRHPGQSETRWVDNLLYLYTAPFDIVIDPFAGGGSTIDLCKTRFRRYWVCDRKPIIERAHEIRSWDMTAGTPPLPRWKDVRLIYLDPPYWKQAEGAYSTDPTDLANMELAIFTTTLGGIIAGFAKKLSTGSVIAMLMQPTQWRAPDKHYTDHVADMLRLIPLPLDMRYQCPYESQQCTAQMVEWAKVEKLCLVLSRELVVWRIP